MVNNTMPFVVLGTGDHRASYAPPLQMIRDRMPCRFRCVRLRFGHGRGAAFDHPPVIKHTRDMPDLGGLQFFSTAQRQIVIL